MTLERLNDAGRGTWLGTGVTDEDGRLRDLLEPGSPCEPGIYRLRFDVDAWFARSGADAFYPEIIVVFRIVRGDEHHHVPVLLTPYGYTTYRGS